MPRLACKWRWQKSHISISGSLHRINNKTKLINVRPSSGVQAQAEKTGYKSSRLAWLHGKSQVKSYRRICGGQCERRFCVRRACLHRRRQPGASNGGGAGKGKARAHAARKNRRGACCVENQCIGHPIEIIIIFLL